MALEPSSGFNACLCLSGFESIEKEYIRAMSKAFIAGIIQQSTDCTGVAANAAAGTLVEAIVKQMKKDGGFTLPSFGTFTVRKTKARKAMNPRTGEPVKVKAGKTVRFKASPNLKKAV
jgi:DNA-binding protein HU-beta